MERAISYMKKLMLLFVGIIFAQNTPVQIPQGQNLQMPQLTQQNEVMPIDPELQKAIEEYQDLIQKYPEKSGLHYNLGNLKYLAGDYEGALNEFRQDLSTQDSKLKSDAIYNMGNTMYNQGKFQESMDFYKQAIELNPEDEDAKINYEISKRMLQQQQQQQQNSENNEDKEDQEKDEEQKQEQQNQDSQNQEGEQKDSGEEQEEKENQQDQQSQNKEGEEEQEQEQEQKQPQESEEEKLAKEEAESILNALQANQKNLMKKKYKAKNRIKLEKDW